MDITSIGIDLGKTTFHLVALDNHGKIVIKKKFSRKQLLAYTANLPSVLVGIEACSGAHFIGAALRDQGHDVRLIPAQFVKPFLKSNKNDFLDAEAIAEAVARQNMRFVPIKTDDQLDLQALHRVRDRLVHRRTAVINQIRGFLLERGITFAKGPANLRHQMPALLEDADQNLTPRMRSLLDHLWQEWKGLNADIENVSDEIDAIASQDAPALAPDTRSGAAGRHRDRSSNRQRRGVPQRARVCRLARSDSATTLDRRQGAAARHQQTRQCLSAPHVHSRCACHAAASEVRHRPIRAVGTSTRAAGAA